jgi:hypothetical protein
MKPAALAALRRTFDAILVNPKSTPAPKSREPDRHQNPRKEPKRQLLDAFILG